MYAQSGTNTGMAAEEQVEIARVRSDHRYRDPITGVVWASRPDFRTMGLGSMRPMGSGKGT